MSATADFQISADGEQFLHAADVRPSYVADFSLALINRTGAYYVGRDLVQSLPNAFSGVRYWRYHAKKEPSGLRRRLLGQAMLLELRALRSRTILPWPPKKAGSAAPTLFLDPLYVLRSQLEEHDIVLCHDVGPLTHSHLFDHATTSLYQQAYAEIKKKKPGIVFVSWATRNEFIALFGCDYRFLQVIPLYVRAEVDKIKQRAPAGISPPFLLTVGALETRKNYERIIEAFAASGLRERGYSYVFCGPRGNRARIVQSLAERTKGVQYLGYRTNAEVCWLYRHATGFVLPSLLEGFGLPALEAAQQGLVSVVSMSAAQQEAVGEGAILVDPLSVDSICKGITQLVDISGDERRQLLVLAKRHAAHLSKERFLRSWSRLLSGASSMRSITDFTHISKFAHVERRSAATDEAIVGTIDAKCR